jgi:hypothetical protein
VIRTDGHELQVLVVDLDSPKYTANEQIDLESYANYTIVGVDLGQKWFGAYIQAPDEKPSQMRFKMKALQQPSYRHRYWLRCQREIYSSSSHNVSEDVFYNSTQMKKRRNYLRRAAKGERDRALNMLLVACGSSINQSRRTKGFKPIVFLIGDAEFKTGYWSGFNNYIAKKLKSLGHIVHNVWEYNTSQKCPQEKCGHSQLEYQGVGFRIKYCRKCHIFYHRDVVAGQNNVVIFLYEKANGKRPEAFSPPSAESENEQEDQSAVKKKRKRKLPPDLEKDQDSMNPQSSSTRVYINLITRKRNLNYRQDGHPR